MNTTTVTADELRVAECREQAVHVVASVINELAGMVAEKDGRDPVAKAGVFLFEVLMKTCHEHAKAVVIEAAEASQSTKQ